MQSPSLTSLRVCEPIRQHLACLFHMFCSVSCRSSTKKWMTHTVRPCMSPVNCLEQTVEWVLSVTTGVTAAALSVSWSWWTTRRNQSESVKQSSCTHWCGLIPETRRLFYCCCEDKQRQHHSVLTNAMEMCPLLTTLSFFCIPSPQSISLDTECTKPQHDCIASSVSQTNLFSATMALLETMNVCFCKSKKIWTLRMWSWLQPQKRNWKVMGGIGCVKETTECHGVFIFFCHCWWFSGWIQK